MGSYEQSTCNDDSYRCELTPEQEAALEHYVDTTGHSYGDARDALGLPPATPPEALRRLPTQRKIGETIVQFFVCGDCYQELRPGEGCSHVRIGAQGEVYQNDDQRFLKS